MMGSFAVGSIDIERLVRLIMADLSLTGGSASAPIPATPVPSAPVPAAPSVSRQDSGDAGELRLTSRVITLKAIQQAATPSVKRVVVPKGAVVTPLVYDELKDRGWELIFDGAASSAAGQKKPAAAPIVRMSMVVHTFPLLSLPLSIYDPVLGTIPVEAFDKKCLMEAAELLAASLTNPRAKGILFTKYTAAGSALCNRQPELRALIGRDLASLEKDAESIGANLLILDPGMGLYRARQMLTRFAALGVASCPPVLQKGLAPPTRGIEP